LAWKGKDIVALLDIGTARISIAVARLGPAKSFEVLAGAESPSLGVRKGIIKDVYPVARIIDNLVGNIRERIPINPSVVYAVFSGTGIKVIDCRSRISVNSQRRVTPADISALLKSVRSNSIPDGFVELHAIPLQYRLDGRAISFPEGSAGRELEADVRLVVAGQEAIQAVYDAVRPAGIRVRKVVFTPLAGAPLIMNGAELELGCILVDLGAGTTTVAAFKYGKLLDALVLPVGMEHVVGDLAVGLRTTMSTAGKLLRSVSLVNREDLPDTVEVPGVENGQVSKYEKLLVFDIIDARLQEICELIKQSIVSINLTGFIPGGVKLTGGGSLFPGIAEHFSRCLELEVKEVLPHVSVPGEGQCRLSLAGLASYCSESEMSLPDRATSRFESILGRLQGVISTGNYFLRRRGG